MKRWKVMSLATSLITAATLEWLYRRAFENGDMDTSELGPMTFRAAAYALIAATTHLFFLSNESRIDRLIKYRDVSRVKYLVLGAGLRRCKRVNNDKGD